jgi:hypothetical protein
MTDWKQFAEDKAELKAMWEGLEIPFDYPQSEIPLWLHSYGKDSIEEVFVVLMKNKHKVIADSTAYMAKCLRTAKKRGMTPEEKAEEISMMRSVIGTIGAAKRHEKEINRIKDEFAEVCEDLPE